MRVVVGLAPLSIAFSIALSALSIACSRPSAPAAKSEPVAPPATQPEAAPAPTPARPAGPPLPPGAAACATPEGGPVCVRFASTEDAFRWVLAHDPAILAIGEAHAQKGTESIASATKRFTDAMVPLLEGRASDLLLEAWAPDPRCKREVKQVASAQAPVKQAQAESNPNEYVAMGTRAKAVGVQPHLLRPTCDDFADLADAGADVITASLALIKRLTQAQATQLHRRNESAKNGKLVVTYGGAMHNDLAPSDKLRAYSFGPELSDATSGRYVELDLIVPEYVKKNETWEKLPWFAAWQADTGPRDKPTLYTVGERSFVLLFPATAMTPPK
ncbi:MAG: hypothetical protein KF819_22560 [Labilithrix sp.]|nr:hypothetical protein [Labilithrix sp.]